MTELKKCPHCGGEAEIYADSIYFVECKNCEIGTRIKATEPEAIAAWNKRAKEENSLTLDEIRAVFQHKYCMNCISFIENENCEVCDIDVVELMQEFEKACKESNLIGFIEKEAK